MIKVDYVDSKKILKIASLSILVLFIIIFAFFRSKNLIFGVKIENVKINDVPVETVTKVTDNIIKITGNAQNAVFLTLNDRVISIDQKGNFEEIFALSPGYNIIKIAARDKFGNSDEKIYKLIN